MKCGNRLLVDFIYDKNRLSSRDCITEDVNIASIRDDISSYYVVFYIFGEYNWISIDKLDLLGFVYLNGL